MLTVKPLVAVLAVTLASGCSSSKREQSGGAGSGPSSKGGAGAGFPTNGGNGANPIGTGGMGIGGVGGATATCADAKSVTAPVVPPLSIPLRFVLLYDPALDDPALVASWTDFTAECGSGAVSSLGEPGQAPWSECTARRYLERTNAAFKELLGSETPLFAFDSYEAIADARFTRSFGEEIAALLDERKVVGKMTVVVVQSINGDIAGVASKMQPVPDEDDGDLAVIEAGTPWQVLAHEVGHAVGFPHVAGWNAGAMAKYDCCGIAPVATQFGDCDSDSNLMCDALDTIGTPPKSFDSCQHGAFLKQIVGCWLSKKPPFDCKEAAPPCQLKSAAGDSLVECSHDGFRYNCFCPRTDITFQIETCDEAAGFYTSFCQD